MKTRTEGFLAEDKIARDSEIFNYIKELHEYLWKFSRIAFPGASGDLKNFVDRAVIELSEQKKMLSEKQVLLAKVESFLEEQICKTEKEII